MLPRKCRWGMGMKKVSITNVNFQDKLMSESKLKHTGHIIQQVPYLVTIVYTTVRFRILLMTAVDSAVALWIKAYSKQGGVTTRDHNALGPGSSGCPHVRTLHRLQILWRTGRTTNTRQAEVEPQGRLGLQGLHAPALHCHWEFQVNSPTGWRPHVLVEWSPSHCK